MPNLIVFTDLDSTLLDHDTYSFAAAIPALTELKQRNIPLGIVTSKTRVEIKGLREQLNIPGPDISENGSWSRSYDWICQELMHASRETRVAIRSFHQMSIEEISAITSLPPDAAQLAAQREFSEPFYFAHEEQSPELLSALENRGLRWTRGGRFHHVFERGSKGEAVKEIQSAILEVVSIGLGDAPNDISFLSVVDYPVIIRSPKALAMMEAIPHAFVTQNEGPEGWNEAVLNLLESQGIRSAT